MTSETSIPFERYDDEFSELLVQIERSLEEDPPSVYSENLFQQADDLIKQMALEARSVPDASLKRALLEKVRQLKTKLASLQSQSEKAGLFRTSSNNNGNGSREKRLLLQQTEDTLAQQNDTLERARRTMQETEQVALEITEELGNNREKLVSAHGRVREVSGMTGRARRILQSMNQRAVQQKLVMYGVAVGLGIGFLFLVYTMFR